MAKIIELSGMPRARKTTLAQDLKDYLIYEKGLSVRWFIEAAHECPLPKADKEKAHIWIVNATINNVLEAKFTRDYDVAIIDRGVFDELVFTAALSQTGQLSKNLAEPIVGYIQQFCHLEDFLILFLTDPIKSYQSAKVKLSSSSTRNPEFLSVLYDCYKQLLPNSRVKHLVLENEYASEQLQGIVEQIVG